MGNEMLIGCIVSTKNPNIIRLMASRGCASTVVDGYTQFQKEPISSISKNYVDTGNGPYSVSINIPTKTKTEINKRMVDVDGQIILTDTGYETSFQVIATIKVKANKKKKTPAKTVQLKGIGVGVFSKPQNRYYAMFDIPMANGTMKTFFFERYKDEDGNKGEYSDRIYEI